MTWVSDCGRVRLHNCDCMEFMRGCADGAYQLAVVDPPYGIGEDKLHSKRRLQGAGKLKDRAINLLDSTWDNAIPDAAYFADLDRVSDNRIIWGGNYFPLSPTRCVICWDKCQPWENFSQWEMAWTSFDHPASLFRFDNRTGGKIHATQKPIELYRWLLERYAKPGDRILDTHVGSGSSLIAAWEKGYEIDGCELDTDYFNAAVARIKKAMQQPSLPFDAVPAAQEQEVLAL